MGRSLGNDIRELKSALKHQKMIVKKTNAARLSVRLSVHGVCHHIPPAMAEIRQHSKRAIGVMRSL